MENWGAADAAHEESGVPAKDPAEQIGTDQKRPTQIKIRQQRASSGKTSVRVCHKIDEFLQSAVLRPGALM